MKCGCPRVIYNFTFPLLEIYTTLLYLSVISCITLPNAYFKYIFCRHQLSDAKLQLCPVKIRNCNSCMICVCLHIPSSKKLFLNMFGLGRGASRLMSTVAKAQNAPYPFSKTALIPRVPLTPPPKPLRQGIGLMQHLKTSLPTPEKQTILRTLFSRHSSTRLYPGSILTVTLDHAPTTFTGVLLSIRRRGPDTSFILRNIVQRTGVEMQFFVCSPHLKDIKLVRKPPKGRMRKAKLFYLRDSPEQMSMIAGRK